MLGAGVYGGYFGAAQGVLLMAILGHRRRRDAAAHNAVKNVLAGARQRRGRRWCSSLVADVDWAVAGLIGLGSVVGGCSAHGSGRRLPPSALRVVIVVVGVAALAALLLR